jgi:L-arabinokinase
VAIAFCISGHGFGHASRQVEVINAFGALRPDVALCLFTQASPWLLDRTLRVPTTRLPWAVDTGAVQRDSLRMDIDATLDAATRFESEADAAAVALAREFRAHAVGVVVCDAPAMPCTAAALAGVPAIVLANFTWDWIYEDFTADHPGHEDLPRRLGARYAEAEAAWRLPMHGGFGTIRTVLDFPWIARRSTHDPRDTRRLVGADDDRPLVLMSFGGYGVSDMTLAHHAGAPYRLVLSAGAQHGTTDAPADCVRADRDRLDALGLRYEDLVAACDVVVSKPGYGIVSECVANGTALLYTDRGRFREYPVMVEQMPAVLRSAFLSNEALTRARWDAPIAGLLAQAPPPERPLVNGADVAAGMLSAMT